MLLDWVGTLKMEDGLLDELCAAGVHVSRFRPPHPYALRRLNNRTHRKVLVADGAVGMIGGVGIAEEWTGDAQDPDHWRDTHVRVAARSCAACRAPSPRTGSRRRATPSSATPCCRP